MPTLEAAPEELRVPSLAEIATYLLQLQRDGAGIMLSAPHGLTLSARIRALDPGADLLGLEIGADPEGISQALVAGGEITAVAYLGSIKLQFELDEPVLVSDEQGAVLRSTLPTRLYRFQRRQAFRVQPAGSTYPRVVLPAAGAQAGRALRVLDISIGGLALALPPESGPQADPLQPLPMGRTAQGLVLELDRITTLRVSLLPHHASPIGGDVAGTRQLGCAFIDLDTAAMRALQVYVDQTQKRRRLLKLDA